MRRILLAFMSTVAAVVMLFGYRTSTPVPATAATTAVAAGTGGTDSTTGTTGAAPAPTPTSTAGSAAGTTATSTKTVTGATAETRWGPVQVAITVSGTQVTAVSVLQSPSSNGRDIEINDAALPVLKQETLQAQNANIDSVSGATYTSDGYITSLQSALDQAGL